HPLATQDAFLNILPERCALEIKLRTELEQPSRQNRGRLLPNLAVRVVAQQCGADVEQVEQIELALRANAAHPEVLRQAVIELVEAIAEHSSRCKKLNRCGARREVAPERPRHLAARHRITRGDLRARYALKRAARHETPPGKRQHTEKLEL